MRREGSSEAPGDAGVVADEAVAIHAQLAGEVGVEGAEAPAGAVGPALEQRVLLPRRDG
jgi:hypothetical protein